MSDVGIFYRRLRFVFGHRFFFFSFSQLNSWGGEIRLTFVVTFWAKAAMCHPFYDTPSVV